MDMQITRLPLELQSYFFPESQIIFSPSENEGVKFSFPPNINIATSMTVNESHPEMLEISVRVQTIKDADEKKYNLEFNICALGFFKDMLEQERNELTNLKNQVNGAAILLGAIRERIAVATGTSPFGPYFLPSLSIRIVDNSVPKEKKIEQKNKLEIANAKSPIKK